MKTLRSLFAAALMALPVQYLAPPAIAQTTEAPAAAAVAPAPTIPADPALWVVKDKDTTIYLFGTIHVLKTGIGWLNTGIRKAFDASDTLVLEMVQPPAAEMQAIVMKAGLATDGKTMADRLPEADRPIYTKALSDLGMPTSSLDPFHPWLAAVQLSLLPILKAGYDPANGPETVLTAAAKSANKPVIGLETAAQQIGFFGTLSQDAQVKYLSSTLKELPKVNETLATMITSWSEGKPDQLGETINEGMRDTPEVAKILLTDRNAHWAEWINTRMAKPGTVFIAVGAGHLAGKDSVIEQLRKYKLTATRVKY